MWYNVKFANVTLPGKFSAQVKIFAVWDLIHASLWRVTEIYPGYEGKLNGQLMVNLCFDI